MPCADFFHIFRNKIIVFRFYRILIAGNCSLIACLRHHYFVYVLLNGETEVAFYPNRFFFFSLLYIDREDYVTVIHLVEMFSTK